MKTSIKFISLATLCVAVYTLQQATVQADDATSNATITTLAGTDPVDPVDPTNPDKPGENPGNEGNNTGQTGPLQINYVSNLLFGDQVKLTGKTVEANIVNTATPYFQVSDLRGTGAGWKLNVTLGDFEQTQDKTKTIKGAQIQFSNGSVRTSNSTQGNAATTSDLTLFAGATGATALLTADKGKGRGTWLAAYDKVASEATNSKVKFSAPTESIDAQTPYEATLTWQLADASTAEAAQ